MQKKSNLIDQQLMTRKQVAEYLHISMSTFNKIDIPFVRLRRKKIYFKETVDAWLKNHEINFNEGV